jgi:hypothetical protein
MPCGNSGRSYVSSRSVPAESSADSADIDSGTLQNPVALRVGMVGIEMTSMNNVNQFTYSRRKDTF